ncbi:F-box protein At3g07870-like [Rutidosis leptorrhynchoides]|uniref:F-box protein At3g07870-like n=1 Tax=Rutidosis leptorrhynchoides TaxID=125765 RepID=UPI003A9A211B
MDSSIQNEPRNKKPKLIDEEEKEEILIENPLCNGFDILPRDVLLDILTRLPISSLIQFRFVCKSCDMLSRDPELPRMHHQVADRADPILVFHCDYPIRNQLYFVGYGGDHSGNKIVRKISTPFCGSMPEFNVMGSCNGLLCLSDSLYGEPVYLFNPFTRNHLELPKPRQFQDQEVVFGFGFNPVTNEYKVVRIVYYRTPRRLIRNYRGYPTSEVQVLTIGQPNSDNVWRCLGKVPYQLDRQAKEAVVVNGRLHWVSRLGGRRLPGRTIVSFDLEDEKFKLVTKPVNRSNYHLAVIDGCLAVAVSCGYGKLEIWVMKEYDVKDSWTKQFDIHGAYLAKVPSHDYRIWREAMNEKMVRVLCVLKNGEILMEYRGGRLVKYDPKWKEFKDVVLHGMPKLFQTFVHAGTLNWTHTLI